MERFKENTVTISEDGMTAWLYLVPPTESEEYDPEELSLLLQEHEILFGVNHSNLVGMCRKKIYHRSVKIAEGRRAEMGEEGYYEFYFEQDIDRKHPKIREDGSTDYSSMSILNNVNEGDHLATYHPAKQGRNGKTVTGEIVEGTFAKDLAALICNGCSNEKDENEYYALVSGKVEYDFGKLSVLKVHTVGGDVDSLTGKVEFFGDVVICGNVSAGSVIRAGKSLTIEGTVEGASIYAGGDIILKRGVQGGNKGKIVTRGNLMAEFIEHCEVQAAGNINSNVILNSEIEAEGQVILTGRKGCILGGHTHATHGISATDIGNAVELPTSVHVGVQAEVYEHRLAVNRQMAEITEKVNGMVDEIVGLMRLRNAGKLSPDQHHHLVDLLEAKNEIQSYINAMKADLQETDEAIMACAGSKIRVEGSVYGGVSLGIDNSRILISQKVNYTEFRNESGMIETEVIVI